MTDLDRLDAPSEPPEERYRIGSHFMRHRWFVYDTQTDDPISEHRTRDAAIDAADRLNAALRGPSGD